MVLIEKIYIFGLKTYFRFGLKIGLSLNYVWTNKNKLFYVFFRKLTETVQFLILKMYSPEVVSEKIRGKNIFWNLKSELQPLMNVLGCNLKTKTANYFTVKYFWGYRFQQKQKLFLENKRKKMFTETKWTNDSIVFFPDFKSIMRLKNALRLKLIWSGDCCYRLLKKKQKWFSA